MTVVDLLTDALELLGLLLLAVAAGFAADRFGVAAATAAAGGVVIAESACLTWRDTRRRLAARRVAIARGETV